MTSSELGRHRRRAAGTDCRVTSAEYGGPARAEGVGAGCRDAAVGGSARRREWEGGVSERSGRRWEERERRRATRLGSPAGGGGRCQRQTPNDSRHLQAGGSRRAGMPWAGGRPALPATALSARRAHRQLSYPVNSRSVELIRPHLSALFQRARRRVELQPPHAPSRRHIGHNGLGGGVSQGTPPELRVAW